MTGPNVERLLSEAIRARESGSVAEARRHFEAVLALDPNQPMARNALGLEALAAGDAQAAAENIECACHGDPGAAELWLNLAAARAELNQVEAARAALERALSVDQRFLPALIGLAQLHEELGEKDLASERWSAVLALTPSVDQSSGELA